MKAHEIVTMRVSKLHQGKRLQIKNMILLTWKYHDFDEIYI